MVFPVIGVVLFYLSFPILIFHSGYWSLYQTVSGAVDTPVSWPGYMLQHDWGFLTMFVVLDWLAFFTASRCLFIFEPFGRANSMLVRQRAVSVLLGAAVSGLYAAGLLAFLHWYYPLEAAANTLWGASGAAGTWIGFGVVQGTIAMLAICLGVTKEQPTAHLQPPPAEQVSGDMPVPIR